MADLRPILAILGLLVVAGGLFFWLARLRGWRFEWWDRFFSPGRRRGPRSGAGEPAAARSGRGTPKRADRTRASSTARSGPGSNRQTLIDLDFLPLLDPDDAVRGTTLDREYDVGDLGSIDTEAGREVRPARARAAPSPSSARDETGPAPASRSESGRRPASRPRRPPAGEDSRAGSGAEAPAPRRESRELLVVLTIMAPSGRDLSGSVIREALAAFDLHLDDDGMFHHYGNRRGSRHAPVFSVANVLDPGVFDLAAMDELSTPGLCLFLRRPGSLPAAVAFDLMLDVGARLSRALDAVLCDDQHCRLTVQATQALRERVVHFALRHERTASDVR